MSRVFLILRADTAKTIEQVLQKRVEYIDANAKFQHSQRDEMLMERAHLVSAVGQLKEPA